MMLSPAAASAFIGIQTNLQQFAQAAEQISDPSTVADVGNMVAIKLAQQGVEINVAVLQKADEMQDALIDIVV